MKKMILVEVEHDSKQKFHIGDIVRISNPKSWFAKEHDSTRTFRVLYSYYQDNNCGGETAYNSYMLHHLFIDEGEEEENQSGWYEGEELSLIKCPHKK